MQKSQFPHILTDIENFRIPGTGSNLKHFRRNVHPGHPVPKTIQQIRHPAGAAAQVQDI